MQQRPRTAAVLRFLIAGAALHTHATRASIIDFGAGESLEPHDEARNFNIQIGDVRLPLAASSKGNQLRTGKKAQQGDLDSEIRSKDSEKASKSSKKGNKSKIPYDLFRSYAPTPIPMPTTQPPHPTMYPSIATTYDANDDEYAEQDTTYIPYSKNKKDYRDDDDDDGEGGRMKKSKYAGAALPSTYKDVKEKFIDPDAVGPFKPSKKLSPETGKDGKTHYVYDNTYEKQEAGEAAESSESQGHYKKSKRHESTKGSSAKLQKSKQEPNRPMHRVSHAPHHAMSPPPNAAPPSFTMTDQPTVTRTSSESIAIL